MLARREGRKRELRYAESQTRENGMGDFPTSNDAAGLFLLVNYFTVFRSPLHTPEMRSRVRGTTPSSNLYSRDQSTVFASGNRKIKRLLSERTMCQTFRLNW
jgi:hypothetical protein